MTANQAALDPSERPMGDLAPLKLATLRMHAALLACLGPGILWAALAQGSGELSWWPYMTAKYGAAFLGLLILNREQLLGLLGGGKDPAFFLFRSGGGGKPQPVRRAARSGSTSNRNAGDVHGQG